MIRQLLCVLWLLFCGCEGRGARNDGTTLVARPSSRASELAPDLVARSRALLEQASHADGAARQELLAGAELFRQASELEAERIELTRARHAQEARQEAALVLHAQLEREAIALTSELHKLEAIEKAQQEARRFLPLTALEGRALARVERDEAVAASAFLRERAALLVSAAELLGARPQAIEALRERIALAGRAPSPGRALVASLGALAGAEAALGDARLARPLVGTGPGPARVRPSREERASLLEAASERGLAPRELLQGVSFALESSLRGAELRTRLAHLRALLRLHPHGTVRIESPGASERALAERIARELRRDGRHERIEIVSSSGEEPGAATQIVLSGYGTSP